MITYSIIQKTQLEKEKRIDPQYFQLEYLELENKLANSENYKIWGEIGGKFITGPFGSEFDTANYTQNSIYRYVRGKDVRPFFLLEDDNVHIPPQYFEKLKKYSLEKGDILISVVGTLGYTSIVDEQVTPAIFSCKSTAYRPEGSIDPFYLISFLNSKYGYRLLARKERGANQTGLNIEDLKSLSIFVPPKNIQDDIGQMVKNSKQAIEDSKRLYQQAEGLLLSELGLKDFRVEDEPNYVMNLSDVKSARRVDADYFQPKYGKLLAVLNKTNSRPLTEVVKNVAEQFDPGRNPDSEFRYVELSNINSSTGVIDGFSEVMGKNAPSRARRILKTNDVIVSSVEGSLEKVAIVSEDQDDYLASTGFFQLRSKEVLPEALLVITKSIVMQWQMKKHCAGTILTAVPSESLGNMIIPVLPRDQQEEIAGLVRQSHEARKKSKELLEEAKRKVEQMVEKGGK